MYKKFRKKVFRHRFQKSSNSLSDLISTGSYKRKLSDLAKNNKSLALALEDARCESRTQRNILKDYMEDCNKVRLARIKLKTMAATIQKLITDLDDVNRQLDINITEKHLQFIEIIQKDSSPSSDIRMKIWDPAVSCIEEASASSIEPDISKEDSVGYKDSTNVSSEMLVSFHSLSEANELPLLTNPSKNNVCEPVIESTCQIQDSVTPVLYFDNSKGVNGNENKEMKENDHNENANTVCQLSVTPEFDAPKRKKSSGQKKGQSFQRSSRKDISEKKNSKGKESFSKNMQSSEECTENSENQIDLRKHDSKILLTPELVLPISSHKRTSSSSCKKVQTCRTSSRRKASEKNSGKVNEFPVTNPFETENNTSSVIQNVSDGQNLRLSLTPELEFTHTKNVSDDINMSSFGHSKDSVSKRKNSNKMTKIPMGHAVPDEIENDLFYQDESQKCLKDCEKQNLKSSSNKNEVLSENVIIKNSTNTLTSQNDIFSEKVVKKPLYSTYSVANQEISNKTILISEDMELTEVIPLPSLIQNKNNDCVFLGNDCHTLIDATRTTNSNNMQCNTGVIVANSENLDSKLSDPGFVKLILETEKEYPNSITSHSSQGAEPTMALNNDKQLKSEFSCLLVTEPRSSSKQNSLAEYQKVEAGKNLTNKKSPKQVNRSSSVQSKLNAKVISSDDKYSSTAKTHILSHKSEQDIPVIEQSSEIPCLVHEINKKTALENIKTDECQKSEPLGSENRTPTTCRRSARIKNSSNFALFFSPPDEKEYLKGKKRKTISPKSNHTQKRQRFEAKAKMQDTPDIAPNILKGSIYDFFSDSFEKDSAVIVNSKLKTVVKSGNKIFRGKSRNRNRKFAMSVPQLSKATNIVNQEPELSEQVKPALIDCAQSKRSSLATDLRNYGNKHPCEKKLPPWPKESECKYKQIVNKGGSRLSRSAEDWKIPVEKSLSVRSVSFAPMDLVCNFEKSSFATDISDKDKIKCISKSNFDIDVGKLNLKNKTTSNLQNPNDSMDCKEQNSVKVMNNKKAVHSPINKLVASRMESQCVQTTECHIKVSESQELKETKAKKKNEEIFLAHKNGLESSIDFDDFFAETELYTFIPTEDVCVKELETNKNEGIIIPETPSVTEKVYEKCSIKLNTFDIAKNCDEDYSWEDGKQVNDITNEQNLSGSPVLTDGNLLQNNESNDSEKFVKKSERAKATMTPKNKQISDKQTSVKEIGSKNFKEFSSTTNRHRKCADDDGLKVFVENQTTECHIKVSESQELKETKAKKKNEEIFLAHKNGLESSIDFDDCYADTELYSFIPTEDVCVKELEANKNEGIKIPETLSVTEKVYEKRSIKLNAFDNAKNCDGDYSREDGKQANVITKEKNLSGSPVITDGNLFQNDKSNDSEKFVKKGKRAKATMAPKNKRTSGKENGSKNFKEFSSTTNRHRKCADDDGLKVFVENQCSPLPLILKTKSQSCPVNEMRSNVTIRKKLEDSPVLKDVENLKLPSRKTFNGTASKSKRIDLRNSKENELEVRPERLKRQRKPVSYKLPALNMKMRR